MGVIKKICLPVIDYFLSKIITRVRKLEGRLKQKQLNHLLYSFQSTGYGVRLNMERWHIRHPEFLVIGNNVHIGDNPYFVCDGGLIIGDNTHMSRNITIYTRNHDYEGARIPYDKHNIKKTVIIEQNVWIGMNVCIIPGITIGEGAIIGMGTIVSNHVKPFEIVGMPPPRILKHRSIERYQRLNLARAFGGIGGDHIDSMKFLPFFSKAKRIFFVLSLNKSKLNQLSSAFKEKKSFETYGEELKYFDLISQTMLHGNFNYNQTLNILKNLFTSITIKCTDTPLIVFNVYTWNIILLIKKVLPNCYVINVDDRLSKKELAEKKEPYIEMLYHNLKLTSLDNEFMIDILLKDIINLTIIKEEKIIHPLVERLEDKIIEIC